MRKWGRAEIVQLDRWWLAGIEIVQGSLGFRLGLDVITFVRSTSGGFLDGCSMTRSSIARSLPPPLSSRRVAVGSATCRVAVGICSIAGMSGSKAMGLGTRRKNNNK